MAETTNQLISPTNAAREVISVIKKGRPSNSSQLLYLQGRKEERLAEMSFILKAAISEAKNAVPSSSILGQLDFSASQILDPDIVKYSEMVLQVIEEQQRQAQLVSERSKVRRRLRPARPAAGVVRPDNPFNLRELATFLQHMTSVPRSMTTFIRLNHGAATDD